MCPSYCRCLRTRPMFGCKFENIEALVYLHSAYAAVVPGEWKPFSSNFQREILNKTQCTSFVVIWRHPCVRVQIAPVVYTDTRQVDYHSENGFPTCVFWMLVVNIILKHVSLGALKHESSDWTISFCRNLFSSQFTSIPIMSISSPG